MKIIERCEDPKCQRYGELLVYSNKYKCMVCPDTNVAEGEE